MNSRIRFYMTFNTDWVERFGLNYQLFTKVITKTLGEYHEVFLSFTCDDGVAVLDMISDLDTSTLEEIITEGFVAHLPSFDESDFYIELDLDVEIDDFDTF